MKSIRQIFCLTLASMFIATSCQDDDNELGEMLDPSAIDFEVIQDKATDPGGNTVILINNTPNTVSMWDYGTGRSTRQQDTVRFAFKGEYVIKFSALTAGGVVDLEPVTIQVTQDNLNYVNHPLWTALSGGPGNEKVWLLDLNAEGVSKYFTSPVYFSSDTYDPNTDCLEKGTCWMWPPEWKGNQWIGAAGDYGTMTFSLKGGPFIKVDHKMTPVAVQNGTYFLDVNAMKLNLTGVEPLHNPWANNDIASWSTGTIISLTENTMQLAFHHKSKAEYMIFNYISKEYSDNWVKPITKDPNFNHGNQSEIIAVSSSKTWKLDLEVPYNWTDLEGKLLNDWDSRADIMATGWAPYGDADVANIDNASITFKADGSVTVTQDNGSSASGTYSLNEKTNMITFSGITPSIPIASWVTANTTDKNQWKIVKVEKDTLSGAVTGIWLGKRDPVKSEYMVFHFVIR